MEAPQGKPYEGPSGVGRDSFWLTAEDLVEGTDAKVKIEKVMLFPEVKFQGGRTRQNYLGLKFAGKARILGLNATNRKALNKMFGNIAKGWVGQTITLFVSEAQMAGETVKCVRIRTAGARMATAAEQFLHDESERGGTKAAAAPAGPIDLTTGGDGPLFGDESGGDVDLAPEDQKSAFAVESQR